MALYNKAGGKVLPGLERRRKAEQALFDTPVAPASPKKEDKLKKAMQQPSNRNLDKNW